MRNRTWNIIPTCLTLALAACGGTLPSYETVAEPSATVLNLDDTYSQAGFVETLETLGATNIVVSMGMSPDGEHVISAVMADLLEHVYLFEDGSYLDRVPIPHDPGHPAVHPTVKVLTHGDGNAVVLFADGLRFEGMETGLLATFDDHGVGSVAPLPLAALAEKHGGLRDVYVGGTELETGILVSGRSESGKPWSRVYVLTLVESRIEVESISSQKAWGCPYYASWRQGQDGRTLFGQVVSD